MRKSFIFGWLLIEIIVLSGCETVKGAANGFVQDIHNIPNPDKNGWNALKRADAWFRENAW